jgi:hypothetical protein
MNGETVVLTIKTADFFAASVPVSGTFRGGVLHLTGGSNLILNLIKADEANFRAQVAALTEQGREIRKLRKKPTNEKRSWRQIAVPASKT